jgi:tetratricopeptide (TPR) repeat protein
MRLKPAFALVLIFTLSLRGAEPTKATPPLAESKAQIGLKTLVARQKDLLALSDKATEAAAVEDLRPQFQRLVNDYEQYLKDYPDVAAGYVSYALLLGKPVLDERKRAAALLLKANQIEPDQPLVQNQLGSYLAEEGRPLEAVSYFLAAVRLAPEEPIYHYQLGTLLTVARDDFLKSGQWTRAAIDTAMHEAFRRAMTLAPDRVEFAYAYGKSFYDLEKPDWDEALGFWRALEGKAATKPLRQTVRLHEANVLLRQGKFAETRALLATVDEPALEKQKAELAAQLPAEMGTAGGGPATITFPAPAGK